MEKRIAPKVEAQIHPETPLPGSIFTVEVEIWPQVSETSVKFQGRNVPLWRISGGRFRGLLGVDLKEDSERIPLQIFVGEKMIRQVEVSLSKREDSIQRLTLPPEKVDLGPKELARVQKEQAELEALWNQGIPDPLWEKAFRKPLWGGVGTPFGVRRFINGEERNPHSGVDLRASQGAKIRAANSGRVVLVADHFFGGNTLVIDHGAGLFTLYMHLSEAVVEAGDLVTQESLIGYVGATGRATGPHLHWGAHFYEHNVDPLSLLAILERE
jgi:murein DD-endopeptidase MepM/ murein hydrolase activator NlpD